MKSNITNIFLIHTLMFLNFSCSNLRTVKSCDFEHLVDQCEPIASEEELSVIKPIRDLIYKNQLNSAYLGDAKSLIFILELRCDEKILWDGLASDSYSDNLTKVMGKMGDRSFYEVIKSKDIFKNYNWINVLFPTSDNESFSKKHRDLFPKTYNWCLSAGQSSRRL